MVHLHVVLCSNALIQSIFALEYVRFSLLVLSKKRLSMFCESDSFCEWCLQLSRRVSEFMMPQKMSSQFPAASETQWRQETFLLVFIELIWLVPARDHFLLSSFFISLTHASMGSKKDGFVVYMCLQGHKSNRIVEIQSVDSYNWSAAVGGCSVGKTGIQGGRGRIPTDMKAAGMYGAVCPEMDNETTDGSCIKMRRQTSTWIASSQMKSKQCHLQKTGRNITSTRELEPC